MNLTAFVTTLVTVAATLAQQATAAEPAGRADQWKKVQEAINKGLPKSAIEALQPIIDGALKDKAYPEAIKALGKKLVLEGNIQGNKPEEKIARLEAELEKAPAEMKPVLQSVLAHWYWQYFQQNRWRFMQRTQTGTPPGKDITTWDLPRLFAEISTQFEKSLKEEATLKKIKIETYADLLEKGTVPDSYRPTLWDFLAHEALSFYRTPEQAGAKSEDTFELTADTPALASIPDFLKWEIKSTDEKSHVVKALKLFQALLKFHQDDQDKAALLDTDLLRLEYAYNTANGEEKTARYKAALKKFIDKWGDHELSATARHHLATVIQGENDLVEARTIALQGYKVFPKSNGGKMCYNLVQQIEAKSAQSATERVWNDPWPTIEVRYRNVTQIHFRLVKVDWVERLKSKRQGGGSWLDDNERKAILAKKPDAEWSENLPATDDYQERTETVKTPKDLKPGYYFLLSSHDPKFSEQNNMISFADVWVSKLALILRNMNGEERVDGFVLDANTGEPVEGAEIKSWTREQNNTINEGPTAKTDKNGVFTLGLKPQRGTVLLATHKDQQLSSQNEFYGYRGNFQTRPHEQTVFFTDRSLYRPGQTVQYKGICVMIDQDKDNYRTIAGRNVTVIFQDPNGKEISRQAVKTNDYGSFSGSFTAPRDRLAGHMVIRTEGQPNGQTSFNVEEYKRPKFQVTVEAPKTAPKLNDKVTVTGKATAYTGAAINDATVKYRVVREVRYPIWWIYRCWWLPMPHGASQEIVHGKSKTGADGSFTVEFIAKPDATVAEKDEPTFHFTVYADVVDTTGETRSGNKSVAVGYTALQASVSAEEWLTVAKPVALNVTTTTLDGEGQKAEGKLKVYKLKQPEKVQRPELVSGVRPVPLPRRSKVGKMIAPTPKPDPSNMNSWELGDVAHEEGFNTDAAGKVSLNVKLPAGAYRVKLDTQDRFGKAVTAELTFKVLDPDAKTLAVKLPEFFGAPTWKLEPGEDFIALWGTGYDKARAYVEVEHRGKTLKSYWTELGATQQKVLQKVEEGMRGGFTVRVTMVRENRAYLESRHVDVPWTNKQLSVKWEHFTSKLEPAQKETWTAIITGPDAKKAVAEMVATLYDKSLDAYLPHHWTQMFSGFRQDHTRVHSQFENSRKWLQHIAGNWPQDYKSVDVRYRAFPQELVVNYFGYQFSEGRGGGFGGRPGMMFKGEANAAGAVPPMAPAPAMAMDGVEMQHATGERRALAANRGADKADEKANLRKSAGGEAEQAGGGQPGPDLSKVSARKNLNETAFFFPHLIADADGKVKLEFTMPEALTEWKFFGFAHDADMRSGFLEDKVVTSKDLMIQPNPPRFVREGDKLEFTVKVSNQSSGKQTGKVALTFADARTQKTVDQQLGNSADGQNFELAAGESKSFSWKIAVPDGLEPLTYKAVGSTGRISDGEEGMLPVLVRRVLVTESLPLPIRNATTKKFDFTKLGKSGQSDTLKHQSLTVQMTSNPTWYAVLALPYLMESPHECSEQVFNRLYANSLARHIALSDPKIRAVFDQWKGTAALDSPMEKNQDLKAVLIEETPWLRQAKKESEARRNVGVLFDENRLKDETARLMDKIAKQQLPDGAWPWFPGGRGDDYITLYITTGYGRLRHLGVKIDMAPAFKSLARLDGWIDTTYREILKHGHKDENHLSATIALYLYGRSFFIDEKPIAPQHKEAVDYFLGQAQKYWLKLANRQSQAHLALGLKRFGIKETPTDIMKSIKERSVSNEEMGMFWRDTEYSWSWFHAPIETQAVMIEAFDEVANDAQAVEECKVWLLKQKQTQDWKTTKATADAVYALLLRGGNWLSSDALVDVALGEEKIKPEKVEAGTGFYEQKFFRGEITPQMSQISVTKKDAGVSWGSVHWQYFEDMSKVTAHEGTPLKLTKTLYLKENTKSGPTINPVKGPLAVGDEVVVRITLRTDRDMEYVHLKDYRGSGTEPTNVLSRYKWQDGLGYYESTKDTASHFFISYLPKGVYVFEYSVRVQHKGQYQTGYANIQCMYAPEFNSHSESIPLEVK